MMKSTNFKENNLRVFSEKYFNAAKEAYINSLKLTDRELDEIDFMCTIKTPEEIEEIAEELFINNIDFYVKHKKNEFKEIQGIKQLLKNKK